MPGLVEWRALWIRFVRVMSCLRIPISFWDTEFPRISPWPISDCSDMGSDGQDRWKMWDPTFQVKKLVWLGKCGNKSGWSILASQFPRGLLIEFCHLKLPPLLPDKASLVWDNREHNEFDPTLPLSRSLHPINMYWEWQTLFETLGTWQWRYTRTWW